MLISTCFGATYLLQLEHNSESRGASKAQVLKSQEQMLVKLRAQGLKVKSTGSQTYLTNVLRVEIEEQLVQRVSEIEGVKQLVKSVIYPTPKVLKHENGATKPLINSAHNLTGVYEVRQQYGLVGKGVKIGIIDTGIDYTHSAFANSDGKACLGPGCRVILGYDFSGQNKPDDCMDTAGGHGTHVSGIVGGNNKDMTGVAPGVVFGGYKVFGAQSGASDFSILSALSQAAKDEMNVVNLSLGSGSGWDNGVLEEAMEELHKKNIIVIAANGNDGEEGLYMASSPAIARNTMAVASMDNKPMLKTMELIVQNTTYAYQFVKYGGNAKTPALPLQYAGDLCAELSEKFPERTIGLVVMGGCELDLKIENAYKSGIAVVLLANDKDDYFTTTTKYDYPVLYLTQSTGQALKSHLDKESPQSVTFTNTQNIIRLASGGGNPSFFTSWGLGSELQIKPEIGAPGHQIFSSIPRKECGGKDCYAVWSGTSMATPYMVGCAALYLEHFKDPKEFKTRAMNTAIPARSTESGIFSVAQQGSGMVNMKALIENDISVSPSKLALGASKSKSWVKSSTITITNSGDKSRQFEISHEDAIAVRGNEDGQVFNGDFPSKMDSPKSVTIEAGQSKTIVVKITPNAELVDSEHWIFSGFVKLTNQEGSVLSIPFGGFKGDYQSINPFSNPEVGLPLILKSFQSQTIVSKEDEQFTTSFNEKTEDIPLLIARFVHPVEALQIQLFNKKTNKAVGLTHYMTHMGRHDGQYNRQNPWGYMYPFVFVTELENGQYCVGCVATDTAMKKWREIPDGEYYMKLIVQKAMGEIKKETHYAQWRSPIMIVKREASKASRKEMKAFVSKSQNAEQIFKHLKIKNVESITNVLEQ